MDNKTFERRVYTAAIAGWWTLLAGYCMVLASWLIYWMRPAWIVAAFGSDLDWPTIQRIWIESLIAFKLCLALPLMGTIWLTIWSRQLRRAMREDRVV